MPGSHLRRAGVLGLAALLFVAAAGFACPLFISSAMAVGSQPQQTCASSACGAEENPTEAQCPYVQPFVSIGGQPTAETHATSAPLFALAAVLGGNPMGLVVLPLQTAAPPGLVCAGVTTAVPLRI